MKIFSKVDLDFWNQTFVFFPESFIHSIAMILCEFIPNIVIGFYHCETSIEIHFNL